MKKAKKVFLLCILALMAVASLLILVSVIDKPRDLARQVHCKNNLEKQLGPLWQEYYLKDNATLGHPPPAALSEFKTRYDVNENILTCPCCNCQYSYYGGPIDGSYIGKLDRTVLFCCKCPSSHAGLIYILMADGITFFEAKADRIEEACERNGFILPGLRRSSGSNQPSDE